MSIARPSYLTRQLRRTLAPWVESVTGLSSDASAGLPRVIWAEQNLPRPTLPYVSLQRRNSNSVPGQTTTHTDFPTRHTVQILTTTPGEAVKIRLNFGTAKYIVQGGDADTAVRDGLIAAIAAGSDPTQTQITGTDSFDLTGLAGAVLSPVDALERVSVTPQDLDTVEIRETSRTTVVRLEGWAFDDPDERALDYLDALIADIGRAQTAAFFAAHGVSIVGLRPTAQDTSALSGAERETRAFADIQVSQWTRHFVVDPEVVESIESGTGFADPDPAPPVVGIEVVKQVAAL